MWQTAFPGYPIKTQFIDFNTLISLIYSPNAPQIFGIGWVADYPDPQDWLSLQFGTGAINNTGSVNVPAANTLMAQADVNLDPTSRFTLQPGRAAAGDQVAWIPLTRARPSTTCRPTCITSSSTRWVSSRYGPTPGRQIYLTSH